MVQPQIPPQPPMVSGTQSQAGIERNQRTAAHDHEDELAARERAGRTGSLRSRVASAAQRLLGRSSR